MRRREFIAGLGSAAAWPLAARAQHPERMRRIGIILPAAADNVEFQARVGAFLQGCAVDGLRPVMANGLADAGSILDGPALVMRTPRAAWATG